MENFIYNSYRPIIFQDRPNALQNCYHSYILQRPVITTFMLKNCVTDTFPAKYLIAHNFEENILHRGEE